MNQQSRTRLALQTALLLIVFGAAAPLRAHVLDVCNKGTVPVVVVTAMKNTDLARGFGKYYWAITSTAIASGQCKGVYADTDGNGAYLGFGFEDAKGQWGSGKVAQVPDFGTFVQWFQSWPVLSRGKGTIDACAPRVDTTYSVQDDPKTDCATMRLTPSNGAQEVHGPFLPITSSLYFETQNSTCLGEYGAVGACHYYLNISPNGTDRELHPAPGTPGGADADPPMSDAQALKLLADKIAELEKKYPAPPPPPPPAPKHEPTLQEQAAAREERQKQILAADAAGNPNVKLEAQIIRRNEETNRQRWTGTRQSPAAYDPQWMGQNLVVIGTVSRVDVDTDGFPQWVTIYLKESPDATFVVCSPYADMFQERVGMDLSALVGKTLEAAGQVESPKCGSKASKGSIRVVESKQWQVR